MPLNQAIEKYTEKTTIRLQSSRTRRQHLVALKDLLYQFHGSSEVNLTLHFDGRGEVDIELLKDLTIRPCPEFFNAVKETFGANTLSVQMKQAETRRRKKQYGNNNGAGR
jgi:DNA polymerase-3 subunit alpha